MRESEKQRVCGVARMKKNDMKYLKELATKPAGTPRTPAEKIIAGAKEL